MPPASNVATYAASIALAAAFGIFFQAEELPLGATLTALAASVPRFGATSVAPSVALGFNVCVDLIVPASDALPSLRAGTSASALAPADRAFLSTHAEAASTFLHYFAAGAAAERSAETSVFAGLVRAGAASPQARRSLGGNAALMARKFASLGAKTSLAGRIGPDAAAMLPPTVARIPSSFSSASASASASQLQPVAAEARGDGAGEETTEQAEKVADKEREDEGEDEDEVHLIAEYSRGEELGGLASPRANRFIVTADASNTADVGPALAAIASADRAGADSGADAIVLAGLHMLEPLPPALRSERLAAVAAALRARRVPSGPCGAAAGQQQPVRGAGRECAAVHLELASSADPGWVRSVASELFPLVDSVGFNEQEGAYLFEALGGGWGGSGGGASGGAVDVPFSRADVAGPSPRAAAVASVLRFVMEAHPSLSRLHFHSLAMHVTAHRGHHAAGGRKWAGGAASVAAGSATASTEACRASAADLAASPDRLFTMSASRFSVADPRGGRATALVAGAVVGAGAGSGAGAAGAAEVTLLRSTAATPVVAWAWEAGSPATPTPTPTSSSSAATTTSSSLAIEFHLAPVVACRKPLATVGLGDAISAAGLAADIVKKGVA